MDDKMSTQIKFSNYHNSKHSSFKTEVWTFRVLSLIIATVLFLNRFTIDSSISDFYGFLIQCSWFRHYSFEPLLSSTCFAAYILIYYIIDISIPFFHKYRIQDSSDLSAWENRTRDTLTHEVPWYLGFWIPFGAIMRARKVKLTSPSLYLLTTEVFFGLLLYDLLFFVGHNLLHRLPQLYRIIHAKHHTFTHIRAGEAIRHTFLDGTWDVTCAVIALNTLKVHTLSRSVFNIIAIFLITEAHCGYSFPWSPSNIIPFQLIAGPKSHDFHHRFGNKNYQKFFTYLDRMFGSYAN